MLLPKSWRGSRRCPDDDVQSTPASGRGIAPCRLLAIYGGYAGYFQDFDGHLWEVAFNPGLGAGERLRNQNGTGQTRLFDRHDGGTFCVSEPINGEPATFANGGTVGFRCQSPEQVKQFHDTAVAHGGVSIEEPPGLREGRLGAMYLACVRDPDGNKLCALHRPK